MWEQFKKRMLQLLSLSAEKEHEKTYPLRRDPISKDQIHTRMTYKYPSNRSFHFPVIPDLPDRSKEEGTHQYNNTQPEKTKNKSQVDNKKEQDKKPFKATDVPSPVYGFTRNKKDVDVPTFIRKRDQSNPIFDRIDKQDWIPTDSEITSENDSLEVIETKEVKFSNEQAKMIEESEKDLTVDRLPDLLLTSDFDEEITEHKPKQLVSEENKVNSERSNVEQTRESREIKKDSHPTPKKVVPFNVIMRPSDKRLQHQSNAKLHKAPPIHLLNDPIERTMKDSEWVNDQKELLTTTLKHFHVRAKVVNAMSGPAVTRFEIQPEPGVKVSKIKNLSDDIKLNLAAKDIRMEAPIPGKNTIGIEVPNPKSQPVMLQEIVESASFKEGTSSLSVALGLDIAGRPIVTDLKKMPHGLIAGATGSGKSVCINTILVSLLYKASHEDVRFLLIDPKMVELAPYNEIPHLVSPVITDVKAATSALKWVVAEMEERYEKFVKEGARDIERYNQKMISQGRRHEKLAYLVIVIDELADLMMVSPQDVEDAICRIAQKARACGIHLLLATQRPSVDVITGLIKANIPTRIAFSVSSQVDSRTILDSSGAEKLLGKGDMLFVENGVGQPIRIQGAFVSDDEIERVTNFVKRISPPDYLFEQEELLQQITTQEDEDELYEEAVEFVVEQNGASASLLQRRFKVGYNRAARLIDNMEANGIISEQKGSKPRDILISQDKLENLFKN
ncbi:DNA translocase FtsK [Aquibacillus salsiterrae]|uniref:DNA translocase FtsK n=1 Tax=Aquibacillus salsiterrae TaxID=2950439 RepID=A0A9X4AF21_9BACI|nr:DNA translocase FtsK [Aquibacillus salsiterrae]MDC3415795.1 DNA translocase FtsK [Aquibacillus salsiterrae]